MTQAGTYITAKFTACLWDDIFEVITQIKMQNMILLFSSFLNCISETCILIINFVIKNNCTTENDYTWYGYKCFFVTLLIKYKQPLKYLIFSIMDNKGFD